jgi:hypothetical protein
MGFYPLPVSLKQDNTQMHISHTHKIIIIIIFIFIIIIRQQMGC